ncbi:MAG: hypothetical protein DMD79_06870 [Candidatus Rokuibacteriota bacterium]|nr:MAG: hypothetical protein DMD79_06870 [Candidatus Rokubacteria bacterium]
MVAAIRAMCDERFLLHGTSASTGGSAPLIVVNGPIRREIAMNATHNALANGSRANATIGRAVRLCLLNLLGCVPGALDRSTLGHPGKFTLCVAEDEEDSPWRPLAQERGVADGVSAVTVVAVESPRQVMNEWTDDPAELCETFAAEMRANMLTYSIWAGPYVLVIPKQLRDLFVAAGWQKRDVREYVHRAARVRREDWRRVGKSRLVTPENAGREFTALRAPDDLLVVAAPAVVRRQVAGGHAPRPGPPGGVPDGVKEATMGIRVLDPTGEGSAEGGGLARPLGSLRGATIGLLDNGKANVTRFLDHVERVLRAEHGIGGVLRRRKANLSAPADPDLVAELARCDAVVSAVGD